MHAAVDVFDRAGAVDDDDAIVRHVLGEVAVELRERALHLVLLVELRGLASRLRAGPRRRSGARSSTIVRSGRIACRLSERIHSTAFSPPLPLLTLWYARLDAS